MCLLAIRMLIAGTEYFYRYAKTSLMSNLQPVFTNRTPSPANYRSCTRCRRRSYNLPRPSLLHSRLEAVVHERQLPPPPHPSFGICWHSVVQARRSSARPASPRPRSLAPTVYISMPVCLRGGACPGSVPAPPALHPPPPYRSQQHHVVFLTRRIAARAGRARPRRDFSDGA